MSDDTPTGPSVPGEPTRPLPEYETVGPEVSEPGSRRVTVIASVAVVVVALLSGGAYAAFAFLNGGGPQPADVLPASTVGVVSVDLDPSAGQKIAAIKSIRRFPALKESLGLHADDDLREFVFDKVVKADCAGLDFDKDVKPWLGKRAAFALVDLGQDHPTPAIALQINDADKARAGFDAIVRCTDPQDFAYVVGDDYLIASDSAAHAKAVLDRGREKPLADDAAYRKWTGEAGDAGVLTFYVGKTAAGYVGDLLDGIGGDFLGFDSGSSDGAPLDAAKSALDGFQGLGGTVRFADEGMELSVAGGGISQVKGLATVGNQMGDLPSDTSAALGFGVDKDFAKQLVDDLTSSGDTVAEVEADTGLDLPGDLQTLLGRAVTLSVGGDAPASLDDVKDLQDVPAGLVIHGDAARIRAVIATIEDHVGVHLADVPLVVDSADGKVAVATTRDYADQLLASGKLGSAGQFRNAVPDADKANGILFLDFDSAWRKALVQLVTGEDGDSAGAEADANTEPLRALGFSSWTDGDVSHALLKIATD
jgi:hypothetical protein